MSKTIKHPIEEEEIEIEFYPGDGREGDDIDEDYFESQDKQEQIAADEENEPQDCKAILYRKCQSKDGCFLSGQVGWIVEAMEEAAKKKSIAFARWLNENDYREYSGDDEWIQIGNVRTVYTTAQVYELFEKCKE